MRLETLVDLARQDRLYPGLLLHGGSFEQRQEAALELGRALLCSADASQRPCGACQHCRRVAWAGSDSSFHPDFRVLERDLRTTTSADATKRFLAQAYSAPFEARGQVFVLAEAETLSGEAADSLLKILEEPPLSSPRHFLLLAPSRLDLLPTLRSRCLSVFLGGASAFAAEELAKVAEPFAAAVEAYRGRGSAIWLLAAAEALGQAGGWEDPRARRPWALAAAAVLHTVRQGEHSPAARRRLLMLAEELLGAGRWRLRGITQGRILEGLVARVLGAEAEPCL